MKQFLKLSLFLFFCSISFVNTHSQNYVLADSIDVIENGKTLRSPFSGGINIPRYSTIDLDGDQVDDLFLFDRDGNIVSTFLNGGTSGQVDYSHAPQYESSFPDLHDWALLRDYNCDGQPDIFTYNNDGIKVFRNTSTAGNLSFQVEVTKLQTDNGVSMGDIYITAGDIPAIVDVDGDGDFDILTFDQGGSFVEWHSNQSVELNNCDTLVFILADACWGKFQESGLSNQISLNVSCKAGNSFAAAGAGSAAAHAGSTVAAFDEDGDGDMELLVGDLLSNKLVYLHNAGTSTNALIDTAIYNFPNYDTPVDYDAFPSAFFLDVNNDGQEDLITGPNPENIGINYESNWLYKNIGTPPLMEFSLTDKAFLQNEMIDVGAGAFPQFFDFDADGDQDLLIGNISFKTINDNYSSLTAYENTGSNNDPEFTLLTRDFQNLSGMFSPSILGAFPAFGDLDGDGDEDLIMGDSNGQIHFLENSGGQGNPASFSLTGFKYFAIDIGQFATPVIVDLDNDNLKDLVIGEMGGTLNFYKNIGTATVPSFSATPTSDTLGGIDVSQFCCTGFSTPFFFMDPVSGLHLLLGEEDGRIYHYGGITGNTLGTWTLLDSNFHDLGEGTRTAITAVDLDGDGKREFAVSDLRGGVRIFTEEKNVGLTAEIETVDWEVFPNPGATPKLRYDLQGGDLKVDWLNLQGQVLGSQPLPVGQHVVNLKAEGLRPGIYFIRIHNSNGVLSVKKWVKR